MASLANYLMHHSLRYAFGIVQIRLFTLPDGSVLALPDVMARTQTIERHVTVVTAPNADIRVAEAITQPRIVSERLEKTSLSLDDFFETMRKVAPESAGWLKDFLPSISDLSLDVQVGKNGDSIMLKSPTNITLMYIGPLTTGFWGLTERFKKSPEGMAVSRKILERIADIASAEIKTFPAGGMDLRINDKAVPLRSFHGKDSVLKEALRSSLQDIATVEDTI